MNRKEKALEFVNAEYHIHVTGRNLDVTDFMKDYALEKISKIERFMNRIIDINVIMDIQKLNHHVEIVLKAGNLKITSSASTTDMYVSIDQAIDKLEAQILRYKSKLQDHHIKSQSDLNLTASLLSNPPQEMDDFDEIEEPFIKELNGYKPHQVVQEEKRSLKTLTFNEAIKKMDQSQEMFLIFKDEADQKLKIMYRRKDEDYGVIEPSC